MRPEFGKPWLQKARDDIRTVVLLGGSETLVSNSVCFHCQQAVEKSLKGLLAALEIEPPKTHDIRRFAELLDSAGRPLPAEFLEKTFTLSSYAVGNRYPGVDPPPDKSEIQDAAQITFQLVLWSYLQVLERLDDDMIELIVSLYLSGYRPQETGL
jgi:HEPN domain-containing protein